MIFTRLSIYKTLVRNLKELIRHAKYERHVFKHILYAVILNDMKEWEEYIGETNPIMQDLLTEFLLNHSEFCLERIADSINYSTSNIPLSNTEIVNGSAITPVLKGGSSTGNTCYIYNSTTSTYTATTCSNKTFTYSMTGTVFKFIVQDSTAYISSAIINNFFNEDITAYITRTPTTYQNVSAVEFTFTTATPLNETITITLQ